MFEWSLFLLFMAGVVTAVIVYICYKIFSMIYNFFKNGKEKKRSDKIITTVEDELSLAKQELENISCKHNELHQTFMQQITNFRTIFYRPTQRQLQLIHEHIAVIDQNLDELQANQDACIEVMSTYFNR